MEFDKTLETLCQKCFFQHRASAVCVSRSNCGNSPRSKFGSPPPCPAAQGQATQTVRTGAQQTAPSPPVLSPHHPWPLCCSPGAGAAWVWPHSPIRPVARGRAWGGQGADQAGRSGACAWRIAFPWPRGIGAAAERARSLEPCKLRDRDNVTLVSPRRILPRGLPKSPKIPKVCRA